MIPVLLVAAVVTLALAPAARGLLRAAGVLDQPGVRSSHRRPVARGGGLAVIAGALAAAGYADVAGRSVPWGLLLGAVALGMVGAVDDVRRLSPLPRLGAQAAAGTLVGASCGGVMWALAGAVVLPVVVNVVNFMDGINGITGFHAVIWGITLLIVMGGDPGLAIVGALTAGAFAGFLPWNLSKTGFFLGDSGSYFFGTLVGVTLLVAASTHPTRDVLTAVVPLLLYFVDTFVVLVRRMRRGAPLWQAHREHTYQVLVNECRRPHVSVAAAMALIAAGLAACVYSSMLLGIGVAILVASLYEALPQLLLRSSRV